MSTETKTCTCCGATVRWEDLPICKAGRWQDLNEDGIVGELRNCTCGTTLCKVMPIVDAYRAQAEDFWRLRGMGR